MIASGESPASLGTASTLLDDYEAEVAVIRSLAPTIFGPDATVDTREELHPTRTDTTLVVTITFPWQDDATTTCRALAFFRVLAPAFAPGRLMRCSVLLNPVLQATP